MVVNEDKKAVQIEVLSEDPPKEDSEEPETHPQKQKHAEFYELSEQDKKLKESLELNVELVKKSNSGDENERKKGLEAIEKIKKEIRDSTSTMVSIPKPLKFLRSHYPELKKYFYSCGSKEVQKALSDVLSILALSYEESEAKESLTYRLIGGSRDVGVWGHEYVRNISGEIAKEYSRRLEEKKDVQELVELVDAIVPWNLKNSAEIDACDILLEVNLIEKMTAYTTKDNYKRTSEYLTQCAQYLGDPDEEARLYNVVYETYLKFNKFPEALRIAVKLKNKQKIKAVFDKTAEDKLLTKQLAYVLSTDRAVYWADEKDDDEDEVPLFEDEISEIVGNVNLHKYFLDLAKDLQVMEAKEPEDIYKSHLAESAPTIGREKKGRTVDSAKANLASSFVNAFVNCGFGTDKLVTPEDSKWVFRNKEDAKISAAASLGMIHMWDLEEGFDTCSRYEDREKFMRAGGYLGFGLVSCGINSDEDAASGLLEAILDDPPADKLSLASIITSLALSYTGSGRGDILQTLLGFALDGDQKWETIALASMGLGQVFCGTADENLTQTFLDIFLDAIERDNKELDSPFARFVCLGWGLLYLGREEECQVGLDIAEAIDHPIKDYLKLLMRACAFAGTGNVVEIQKFYSVIIDSISDETKARKEKEQKEQKDNKKEEIDANIVEVAVIGISMVALGEKTGSQMVLRSLDHILQAGDLPVRRMIPLALALTSVSDPKIAVIDTLSKLTHDLDETVSENAILALGFVSAGTNNSRVAQLLRQLSIYYDRDADHLFLVRIAQGLLHLGKGLMTLSPLHSDQFLLSNHSLSGLIVTLMGACNMKSTYLSKYHFLLYNIATAIRPRCLITITQDEKEDELVLKPIKVRVGQGVDNVGKAGNSRQVTGFQTHDTPVLFGAKERIELDDDDHKPLTEILEGIVIVKKKPKDEDDEDEKEEKKMDVEN